MNIGNISPSILYTLKNKSFTWATVISELCDNSFDADACQIAIKFGPRKELCISDDGRGCDNIEKMLTLGHHYNQATTKLGRYGVGLKDAACWLWGELRIETTRKGVNRKATVDWADLAKRPDWNIPDPIERNETNPEGTKLTFRNIQKTFPGFEQLQKELGFTFAPALWFGKQIAINTSRKRFVCNGWQLPDLTDLVQDRFEINGKRVHLKAGIVVEGFPNDRSGFNYAHEHRIVMNANKGAMGHSTARICGIVELDRDWDLSTNKTDVVDGDSEALSQSIFERCEGILKKAASQAEILRNTALESSITESLRGLLSSKDEKEKRDPPKNNIGGVKPKKTGRRRNNASKRQPGKGILSRCKVGQLRMEWQSRSDLKVGSVDFTGPVVYLNENHPRLRFHRDNENKDALVDQCMTLLAHEAVESEQREKLPLFKPEHEGFVDMLSYVLESHQAANHSVA